MACAGYNFGVCTASFRFAQLVHANKSKNIGPASLADFNAVNNISAVTVFKMTYKMR